MSTLAIFHPQMHRCAQTCANFGCCLCDFSRIFYYFYSTRMLPCTEYRYVLLIDYHCSVCVHYVVCVVCVVIPFILDVRFVDIPAGVTQEEAHTGYLHLFLLRCLPSFFSREGFSRSSVLFNRSPLDLLSIGKIPVRVTTPRFELMSQRQKVSRLPIEPPGRPARSVNYLLGVLCYFSRVKYQYNMS